MSAGRARPSRFPAAELLLFLAAFAAVLVLVTLACHGGFSYSLDDAYIHLAVSEEIARGGYGVNPGEFSATSSSVLWPFLLAPLAGTRLHPFWPLVLNALFAAGTVWLYARLIDLCRPPGSPPLRTFDRAALSFGLVLATNLLGLAFTGMEHSLQVFLTAACVVGAVSESRTGQVPWWGIAALAVAPLVRYENLAISLPLAVYLFARGRRVPALVATAGFAVPLLLFGAFLTSHGVGIVPVSVTAKSPLVAGTASLGYYLRELANKLEYRQGAFLALGAILLATVALSAKRPAAERGLAAAVAVSAALHHCVGQYGWFGRYEIYAWTAVLLLSLYLYREPLARAAQQLGRPRATVAGGALLLCVAAPYLVKLFQTPLGARNTYEQQYQMHRVATEVVKGPVAVNDIGWVSYRNDHYVLDLWGLTSREILARRSASPDSSWLDSLVTAHGVRMVMIYEQWFRRWPRPWTKVADLRLRGPLVSSAAERVSFFTSGPAEAPLVTSRLAAFRKTLPPGVRLELEPEPTALK